MEQQCSNQPKYCIGDKFSIEISSIYTPSKETLESKKSYNLSSHMYRMKGGITLTEGQIAQLGDHGRKLNSQSSYQENKANNMKLHTGMPQKAGEYLAIYSPTGYPSWYILTLSDGQWYLKGKTAKCLNSSVLAWIALDSSDNALKGIEEKE